MLVLSRQVNQSIVIDGGIEITVVEIKGDKVRIGISAPPSVAVHRKEVHLAIQAENQAASQAGLDEARRAASLLKQPRAKDVE